MLGSLKFAVLQFADFHFPQNPRIARTPCNSIFEHLLCAACLKTSLPELAYCQPPPLSNTFCSIKKFMASKCQVNLHQGSNV